MNLFIANVPHIFLKNVLVRTSTYRYYIGTGTAGTGTEIGTGTGGTSAVLVRASTKKKGGTG